MRVARDEHKGWAMYDFAARAILVTPVLADAVRRALAALLAHEAVHAASVTSATYRHDDQTQGD